MSATFESVADGAIARRNQRHRRDRVLIVAALMLAPYMISAQSWKREELGLEGGRLRQCSATPNCVCTEYAFFPQFVPPLRYSGSADAAWSRLKSVMQGMPRGKLVEEQEGYLRMEFSSLVYGFVDDVEFRLVPEFHAIHVRSAARVGYSDFGANRQRVEEIRKRFQLAAQ